MNTVSRVNLTIPKVLLEELKNAVPERSMSKFATEAIRERLRRLRRKKALDLLPGVWDRYGGVSFRSEKELRTWRKTLWETTEKRFKRG